MTKNPLKLEKITPHLDIPKMEEAVLEYWDQIKAFERSVSERPEDKPYVFYDGPPFTTGLPHYGHLLSSIMKDIVPRFWTMQGYRVERRWGWDCHGLPIENIIEGELNLKGGKKGIEAYGIKNFNEACRSAIMRFDSEWKKIIRRIGRWVDMDHSYKTMDTPFMESVWWAFKQLHDKGLVYQGRKVILYCPRCSTPLSNFEIAMDNSYQDVQDPSLTLKFQRKDHPGEYILAWTTTPWTLIGNVGLAVKPDASYLKVYQDNTTYYVTEARAAAVLQGDFEVIGHLQGADMDGWEYEPLFNFLPLNGQKAHFIATADFVSLEEGTGIVHTAAMYGEDDYQLALKVKYPLVDMLDDQGHFLDFVTPLSGVYYKKAATWILEDLTKRQLLYHQATITHSYPFCYRCSTPLYYNAIPAWFVNIQKLKPRLKELNEHINWFPGHLKHGRFGKGLDSAPDWNISRSRYWGTPMPIWIHQPSGSLRTIGSIQELQTWAVDPESVKHLTDIHREHVDQIEIWVDDQKTLKGQRIKEVFDCWVESGSMSFAEHHYPFENKIKFETRFPAQYIVEYIAQTRAWFYTLHVMATAIFDKPAFQNALTTGTIMAQDGTKMSKSKRNFPDPLEVVDKYGVDSLRLYFASSPLMKTAQNVNFSPSAIDEIRKRVFIIYWNIFAFFKLYDNGQDILGWPEIVSHPLDLWLISQIEGLTQSVEQSLKAYDVVSASKLLMGFIADFSQFWLRASRDRLRNSKTNQTVLQVFQTTLFRYNLLLAPFAPFFAENVYQNLVKTPAQDSIHLGPWVPSQTERINNQLEQEVVSLRAVIEKAHAQRKELGIKTRQPLAKVTVTAPTTSPDERLLKVLLAEINVKQVDWTTGKEVVVNLDFNLTPELKAEGDARELVRKIQNARKKAGTAHDEMITVGLPTWPEAFEGYIKKKVLADKLVKQNELTIIRHSSNESISRFIDQPIN